MRSALAGAALLAACSSSEQPAAPEPATPTVEVTVHLDGQPAAGVTLSQGGLPERWTTDATGRAAVPIDRSLDADHAIVASHPDARQGSVELFEDTPAELLIELQRFDPRDNPDYRFREPGTPEHSDSASLCAHCHPSVTAAWFASPHRSSASNPVVQDLYSGVRSDVQSEEACAAAQGRWWIGLQPGTGELVMRCYVGDGVLPALNEGCGDQRPCDEGASVFGGCADCHAPGMDGALGGRDLLRAEGLAHDFGVHCDVCHRVEGLDPSAEPGVAGHLQLLRPGEEGAYGQDFLPLVFGPWDDVPSPFMGAVARPFFSEARFCAGCHEQHQAPLVPGQDVDRQRWPTGRLPIHTTFSEWQASPLAPSTPCQGCHMPPDPTVSNAADLQVTGLRPGVVPGWERPAGAVKAHGWIGPRQPESGLLQTAATLSVEKQVSDGELLAQVTVRNTGAGHALPTGEPMRSLILQVEASCAETPLRAVGGDAVPDFGGSLDRKASGWDRWPGAQVGERIRVVHRDGWHDYSGFGPFGDGTFSASQKGLPRELFVAERTITAVRGDRVTLDGELPDGDIAYRIGDGDHAGAPGFGFARVLASADGRRMVPHFLATDVLSDNRLLPQAAWTSTHRFASPCPDPEVRATLLHRAFPTGLARERGWPIRDSVVVEVRP